MGDVSPIGRARSARARAAALRAGAQELRRQSQAAAARAAALEIASTDTVARTCVILRGELDFATGPVAARAAEEAIRRGLPVQLDLAEVTFIDVAGLRSVVAAATLAAHRRVQLAVGPRSEPVRRLVALTGTGALLPGPPA